MSAQTREMVEQFTRPGMDRDVALAIANQAHLQSHPIDTFQITHLLQLGYQAGYARGLAARRPALGARLRGALRRRGKHAAVALIFAVLLACVLVGGGGYAKPDPGLCDALRAQSESTPDVAYAMEERGCPDPPYQRLVSPSPDVLGRAGDRDGGHG